MSALPAVISTLLIMNSTRQMYGSSMATPKYEKTKETKWKIRNGRYQKIVTVPDIIGSLVKFDPDNNVISIVGTLFHTYPRQVENFKHTVCVPTELCGTPCKYLTSHKKGNQIILELHFQPVFQENIAFVPFTLVV